MASKSTNYDLHLLCPGTLSEAETHMVSWSDHDALLALGSLFKECQDRKELKD